MPKQPEESFEYGVKFPNETVGWPDGNGYIPGIPTPMRGGLDTAQARGAALDSWTNGVKALGLDPDTLPHPTFIRRRRVTSWDPYTAVTD